MEIIFFDKDPNIIETYKRIIGDKFQYITCDVNNVPTPLDYIVSPANSHGLMDGGIDMVYTKMFPGIQNIVRTIIRDRYPDTKLLPVGEVISVKIPEMRRQKVPTIKEIIICPTMVVPSDIRNTNNVYIAFSGLLQFLNSLANPKISIAVPAFGTLTGRMSAEESAKQIVQAIRDNQTNP